MRRTISAAAVLALLAGCGTAKVEQHAAADSLQRDLQLAPADTTAALNDKPAAPPETAATPPAPAPAPEPAPKPTPKPKPKPAPAKPAPAAETAPAPAPAPARPRSVTLASGAVIQAAANDSLHSRHDKAGEMFHATVSDAVKDANGNVVIPAGSVVTFRVATIAAAGNKSEKDGKLTLEAQEVAIGGQKFAISGIANETTVEHTLQGQGVTAGGAARVGGGALGGAIIGKVIGGKTGAIIGGVAGAAGGAAVAAHTADRDVVVQPGAKVAFSLTSDFTVTH
ncbi:MAG TPA: hypothetical protein VEI47_09975 [Gemmatimonadales bacterium]|nr:hypothetical protein [Gemmatimonadales bacterium]